MVAVSCFVPIYFYYGLWHKLCLQHSQTLHSSSLLWTMQNETSHATSRYKVCSSEIALQKSTSDGRHGLRFTFWILYV